MATNILGVLQEIHKANVMLEGKVNEQTIDVGIFHIVLDKVLNNNTKFTEEHRKRYFMETKKLIKGIHTSFKRCWFLFSL